MDCGWIVLLVGLLPQKNNSQEEEFDFTNYYRWPDHVVVLVMAMTAALFQLSTCAYLYCGVTGCVARGLVPGVVPLVEGEGAPAFAIPSIPRDHRFLACAGLYYDCHRLSAGSGIHVFLQAHAFRVGRPPASGASVLHCQAAAVHLYPQVEPSQEEQRLPGNDQVVLQQASEWGTVVLVLLQL